MSDRRIKAIIDIDAVKNNIKCIYNVMPDPKPIMCVIKADAYGHGSIRLAKEYEKMDEVCAYATATAEEALTLRENGIKKPILILGVTFEEDYKALIGNDVSLTVFTVDAAKKIDKCASDLGLRAKVHIKVDTGMSRIGLAPDDSGLEKVKEINSLKNLDIEGLFTHFARADEYDKSSANEQLLKYMTFSKMIEDTGISIPVHHCANSAAILEMPATHLDMVRAGIILYGLWPSNEIDKENISLEPVMSLVSHVSYVKNIPAGTAISYGGTYVAKKEMRIATIPVGYADGYPRLLSSKGHVLIRGRKAPILGRVCMDQMMVDVSNIPGVSSEDRVILLGSDGENTITADDLGDASGRFNYELVCDINPRVPREYKF